MRTALLIDGGHLRAACKKTEKEYTQEFINDFAYKCFTEEEDVYRIFYYDAPRSDGVIKGPISGEEQQLKSNLWWFEKLASYDRFAVRLGRVANRGWELKKDKFHKKEKRELTDGHFRPIFEQKGVDMRIGLDIATLASQPDIKRIILVSNDSDMEPALKHGRIRGLETVIIKITGAGIRYRKSLDHHADITRSVAL